MNFVGIFRISLHSTKYLSAIVTQKMNSRLLHILRPTSQLLTSLGSSLQATPALLTPQTHQITPVCGFKVKGKLRKRCKDCYFVMRDERMYVICPTHPRHKQMAFAQKEKHNFIPSPNAIQTKQRPW